MATRLFARKRIDMFHRLVLIVTFCLLLMVAVPSVVFAEDYTVDVTVGGRVVTLNVSITDGSISVSPVDSNVVVIVKPVEPSEVPYSEKGVALSPANLRSGPGVSYGIVGGARKGEVLDLVAKTADGTWYKTGGGGWIYANLVQIARSGGSAPTMTPAPTPWIVTPEPTSAFVASCDCSYNKYNCGNFDTHNSAQACFNYCVSIGAGDIHQLDRDGDSSACETLP